MQLIQEKSPNLFEYEFKNHEKYSLRKYFLQKKPYGKSPEEHLLKSQKLLKYPENIFKTFSLRKILNHLR